MNDSIIGYAGVDWATDAHAVCVVDQQGEVVDQFDVSNTADGLAELCRRARAAHASRVAIERPDGPVVEALLADGLEVVVVASRSVKAFRERYGMTGNKSDRSDAYVLADCLRTDGHRWDSLKPDSPATIEIRSVVRSRKELVETRVATANRLRAHLQVVFPGALGLFSDLDGNTSLKFLEAFPTAVHAAGLTEERLREWCRAQRYVRTDPAVLYAKLAQAPGGTDSDPTGAVTHAFVAVLVTLRTEIANLETHLEKLLEVHPDTPIFSSLPRCATIRTATLIAEIGDCRARFPDAQSLACLAGVVPSTRASGRYRHVTFRFHCDKKLRNAICDFAGDSWRANAWADARYKKLRAEGKTHTHAERILARSWTDIIWQCLQHHTPYNPALHGAYQRLEQRTD